MWVGGGAVSKKKKLEHIEPLWSKTKGPCRAPLLDPLMFFQRQENSFWANIDLGFNRCGYYTRPFSQGSSWGNSLGWAGSLGFDHFHVCGYAAIKLKLPMERKTRTRFHGERR